MVRRTPLAIPVGGMRPCLALGGEINRPDSVELHGGNVPSQETRRFVVAGTDSSKTSNFD